MEDFLQVRRFAGYGNLVLHSALAPLTVHLTGLGVVSSPPAAVSTSNDLPVGAYRRHLVVDRGLAPSTVAHYVEVAREVLVRPENQGPRAGGRVSERRERFGDRRVSSAQCALSQSHGYRSAVLAALFERRVSRPRIWLEPGPPSLAGEEGGSLEV
jgi:hypothetical protein